MYTLQKAGHIYVKQRNFLEVCNSISSTYWVFLPQILGCINQCTFTAFTSKGLYHITPVNALARRNCKVDVNSESPRNSDVLERFTLLPTNVFIYCTKKLF